MIFINYRIADSIDLVARLNEYLVRDFGVGNVFWDKRDVEAGSWASQIEGAARSFPVMLSIVGPHWQKVAFPDGHPKAGLLRLSDPEDWVRREITLALSLRASGHHVIPVYLNDCPRPSKEWLTNFGLEELAACQGKPLRSGPDFPNDYAELRRFILDACPAVKLLPPSAPSPSPPPQRPVHLPFAALGELFIGRDDFLAELHQKFTAARQAGRWPNQAVCGVGGIGKTRLAVEYAWKYRDDYTAVLLVNGDSPDSLRRELAGLARLFVAKLDPATPEEVAEQATMDWLKQHSGWLLIVDNADTEVARNAVTARLAKWANGHVLITARFGEWPRTVESLDLHVLSGDDATRFLLTATDGQRRVTPTDVNDARDLARDDLDGLCLALQQAAAYIAKREISFAEYRRRWQENQLKARTWADKVVMEYPESVATTWLTTFRELTPAARTLLEMLTWLAPDPIPRGLFDHPELHQQLQAAIGGGSPDIDIEETLAELRQYSLISHWKDEPVDSAGRVHRVMQLITRDRLTAEQRQKTLNAILIAVNTCTPTDSDDVRTWPVLDPLFPHLTMLIDHAERAGIDVPTARLMGVIGRMLFTNARYAQAENYMKSALAIAERCYSSNSPVVALRLNNLAQTFQATNRLVEAESLMRRALAIDEQSFGAKHDIVASDLNNLAGLLQDTNRRAEAEPLMRRALDIVEQSYGAGHPNVACGLNNLAQLLQATDRLAEAEPLMRRVLTIFEMNDLEKHPNYAAVLNNLAELLQDTNRLAEAEPLMHRALDIVEQSYGAEHPDAAIKLNNLAVLLLATNRLAEAESLMRRALTIDEQSYGAEHPNVAIDLNNLAQLLQATNRLAEAEPLMRRALAIDEKSYGAEHPNVARDLNNLARLLQDTNRLAEAESLMRRSLAINEQSYGAEHPHIATNLNNLAGLFRDTNRLAEAEPLMRHALIILCHSLVPDHPDTKTGQANYSALLTEMGKSKAEVAATLRQVMKE